MDKKSILIILGIVTLLAYTLTVGRSKPRKHGSVPKQSVAEENAGVPDDVVYGFLFHKVVQISKRTKALKAQGRIAEMTYFPLQEEARLNDAQAAALETIASDCQREVNLQDDRARVVIQSFKAQFPDGKIRKEVTPPSPPAELKVMWEERQAIILRARDRLRLVFGDEEFSRFHHYAKFRYGSNINSASLGVARAASN